MSEESVPFAEVGRYSELAAARERALVAASRDVAHRLDREGDEWVLNVAADAREEVLRELALFESEQRQRPAETSFASVGKIETLSLYVAAWLLGTFFFLQNIAPPEWIDRGAADSAAIIQRGEWWRTVTALTLHADLPHVVANLATGLLFAAFLLPQLGTGLTWLAIVLSGGLGNAINSWTYRGEAHVTIGASTAVFGALGLLVSIDFLARFSSVHTRSRWQLVLPVGAGLALLAYLGSGGEEPQREHIDYMAHFWGFVAGLGLGTMAVLARLRESASVVLQRTAAIAAVTLLVTTWWLALRRS
jgi:membrane associated rhomboid family serine protease